MPDYQHQLTKPNHGTIVTDVITGLVSRAAALHFGLILGESSDHYFVFGVRGKDPHITAQRIVIERAKSRLAGIDILPGSLEIMFFYQFLGI